MSNKINYLIRVAYDGSSYYGSQTQVDKPTIEQTMKECFEKYFKLKISLTISSRTDRGVHALDHPMLIKLPIEVDVDKTMRNLNWVLPEDIQIMKMEKVDQSFHPRYYSKEKTYRYRISSNITPFNSRYVTYYRNDINIEKVQSAANIIIGEHDFFNFTSKNPREDYVRNVLDIKIVKENDEIVFYVCGKGFLRYMVRNIIASLLAINEDKITEDDLKKIINREMEYNFKRSEPNGLCLYEVKF